MTWFHRKPKKINLELEQEKRLAASRSSRTDRVVDSLRELQKRNQFRDQLELTLGGKST